MKTLLPSSVMEFIKKGAIIFVSHSGGKDSQAMLAKLIRLGLKDHIVIVHSNLGSMEWEHMTPWIEKNSFGLPVYEVEAEEDFFQMVRRTKRMPSGNMQFCTDNLKIKPIGAFIHDYMTANNIKVGINATGMRAEESERRAKKGEWVLSKGTGTSGMHQPKNYPEHTIFDWLPIIDYKLDDVMEEIENADQEIHSVYGLGFSRLSCVLCVNGRVGEHELAIKLRPELARKMADLEHEIGKTMRMRTKKGVKFNWYLDEKFQIPEKKAPKLVSMLAMMGV